MNQDTDIPICSKCLKKSLKEQSIALIGYRDAFNSEKMQYHLSKMSIRVYNGHAFAALLGDMETFCGENGFIVSRTTNPIFSREPLVEIVYRSGTLMPYSLLSRFIQAWNLEVWRVRFPLELFEPKQLHQLLTVWSLL